MRRNMTMVFGVVMASALALSQPGFGQAFASPDQTWPDVVFDPRPSRLADGVGEGEATLYPNELKAAAIGAYRLRFTVGESGISTGGGLYVDFPKAWFTNPTPLRKPLQQTDPGAPHYVGVRASNEGVALELGISKRNFDNKHERFRNVMEITVSEGRLTEGDVVDVVFANTTAPYIASSDHVRVVVDTDGSGEFKRIASGAEYTVAPGPMAQLRLFAPGQAVEGEDVALQVTAFDRFWNVASEFTGNVRVSGLELSENSLRFTEDRDGILQFRWIPKETGFVFPAASDGARTWAGGPIRVFAEELDTKIYWGDLHSHSRISKDGIGGSDYAYARDVTRLDFFASTEHDISDDGHDSIVPREWAQIQETVRSLYAPGAFVTLLGYECSLRDGHYNVIYRGLDGVPWPSQRLKTLDAIWAKLEAGEALTIPHHMGIRWGMGNRDISGPELQPIKTEHRSGGGPQVDWTGPHDPALRPALEIYSKHGQSEFYDPHDPLSYEQVKYTGATSVDGPHYARDAWAAGLDLAVVAASDNHMAHPGLPHTGLTAVYAPELTREAIFDALLAGRSYGTTGERIILEFERLEDTNQYDVLVAAPRTIRYAEIMEHGPDDAGWKAASRWESATLANHLQARVTLSDSPGPRVYYLRVELEGETGGRVARAWSSPIRVGENE